MNLVGRLIVKIPDCEMLKLGKKWPKGIMANQRILGEKGLEGEKIKYLKKKGKIRWIIC